MTGISNETFHYQDGALWIDDVPLHTIAEAVGTPLYVYSQRRMMRQLARLTETFAPLSPRFYLSLKANGNVHMVRALVKTGCGCDVVSAGEVFLALRAGCLPEHIVFAGVGKTVAEMHYALENRVGWLNIENAGELARLEIEAARIGLPTRAALRLNPALQADTHAYIATGHEGAKFGLPLAEAHALLANRDAYPHIEIAGLHVHIGSQLGRPDESALAAQQALALAQEFGLTHLNLGGGFPVAYDGQDVPPVEAFAEALCPVLVDQAVQVSFEPGRFLLAEAGALLATTQYIKNGGRTVVLNAGMTELIRPALYGARHPVWPLDELAGTLEPTQVVGPICESSDVLHPAAALPPLEPGDRVAIGVAGAYGYSMASNYNGRLRPPEVLVQGEQWRVVRRRENFEDLTWLEEEE